MRPVYANVGDPPVWRAFVRAKNNQKTGIPLNELRLFIHDADDEVDRRFPEPTCPACGVQFKEGDRTTLLALGPGDDVEAQEKARAGGFYTAAAIEVHVVCLTGVVT